MRGGSSTVPKVPFNRPFLPQKSHDFLAQSLASAKLSGDGPLSVQTAALLSTVTSGGTHLLTPSCTHALELACRLLDLGPGDEVVMPSFNFSSAATAVALTGATPVFIDVDVKTKNMTSNGVAEALTDRTRAVIVLHYAGVLAPVEDIRHLTDSIGAYVIEDGAHGLGVRTKQGTLGSFGTFATYSFHETKNVQCGEGGSLQINDPEFLERAEILREKGTNRQRFFRGQVDKYTWVDQGSSWLLAEPLSALILGQLQVLSEIQQSRLDAFERYVDALEGWCAAHGFEVDTMPPDQEGAAHLFALIAPDLKTRSEFIQHLKDQGVTAAFHYQPLDSSPAGRLLGRAEACPVSAELGDRLVRLPLFTDISESEIDQVLSAVCAFKAS